jgi:hypothetical protein
MGGLQNIRFSAFGSGCCKRREAGDMLPANHEASAAQRGIKAKDSKLKDKP